MQVLHQNCPSSQEEVSQRSSKESCLTETETEFSPVKCFSEVSLKLILKTEYYDRSEDELNLCLDADD